MTTQCLDTFHLADGRETHVHTYRPTLNWGDIAGIAVTGIAFILLLPAATLIMAVLR